MGRVEARVEAEQEAEGAWMPGHTFRLNQESNELVGGSKAGKY